MFAKSASAAILAATLIAPGVQAATVEAPFPSSGSAILASGGEFFFRLGDFAEESFNDTGIADLQQIDLGINLATNILSGGAFVNFDVFVNGTGVGDFTIGESDGEGPFGFGFAVVDPDPVGDDYLVRIEETNLVPSGDGSISFAIDESTVQFTGVPAPIPLPASIPLLLAGLGALGLVARRRSA